MVMIRLLIYRLLIIHTRIQMNLTEVAGEGGPDLAPQKFLSSQKFRHLMG